MKPNRVLRVLGLACGTGFLACASSVLLILLFDAPVWLLKWVGAGAIGLALAPKAIMDVHLAFSMALSQAEKDEWEGIGWGLQPLIVAFFYLLRGGTPLPPGSSARWRTRRRMRT